MTGAKYSLSALKGLMEWLSKTPPFSPVVHVARGMLLEVEDDMEAARREYTRALDAGLARVSPCQAAVIQIERELIVPQMVHSTELAAESVHRFRTGLQTLANMKNLSFGQDVPAHEDCFLRPVYFPAPYISDTSLKNEFQSLGRIFRSAIPALDDGLQRSVGAWEEVTKRRSAQKKPRVGFISSFFHASSNGHTWGPLITRLPTKFTVVVISLSDRQDLVTQSLRAELRSSDEYMTLAGASVKDMQTKILAANLDIIVYVGLGMDMMTYLLAAGPKLAPVQGTTWGHSVTSGLPLDFFVSIRGAETARAVEHYSERRLFLFDGISVYFDSRHVALRRKHIRRKGRADFGLPMTTLYLYPHTLFKLQPEYDAMLRQLLHTDEAATVVVVETRKANRLSDHVFARLKEAIPASMHHRVILLRTLGPTWDLGQDFLDLLDIVDVVLDSFPWGGCTTTFEALQLAQPIVTLPSKYLRGRFTVAMYQQLNETRLISTLVARDPSEFVQYAVRLGKDPALRRELRVLLKRAVQRSNLFDDQRAPRQWGEVLSGLLRETHTRARGA